MAPKMALQNIFGRQKVGAIFEISPPTPLLYRPWWPCTKSKKQRKTTQLWTWQNTCQDISTSSFY